MSSNFFITDTNPNDAVMGGCACHPTKCATCTGPFAVFPESEMEGVGSPHVVLGVNCAREILHGLAETVGVFDIPDPREAPTVLAPDLNVSEPEVDQEAQTRLAEAASETTEPSDALDPETGEQTGRPIGDFFKDLS